MSEEFQVGDEYLCIDGLVRRIYHISKRGLIHVRWREVNDDIWNFGDYYYPEPFRTLIKNKIEPPELEVEG